MLETDRNVPSALAKAPPPQAVIPTLIKLMPINVTTIPETRGVIIFLAYFNSLLINISTKEPAIQTPKIKGNPPVNPVEIIGPIKEKLVPCIHSNPVPIQPIRLH